MGISKDHRGLPKQSYKDQCKEREKEEDREGDGRITLPNRQERR